MLASCADNMASFNLHCLKTRTTNRASFSPHISQYLPLGNAIHHSYFHLNKSLPPLPFRVKEDSLASVVRLALLDQLVPVDPLDLLETMVLR